MRKIADFSQGELLQKYKIDTGNDSLGICMRLTFKWLACSHVGGEFAYENVNVKKSSDKMDAYTIEALDMLRSASFKGDETFSISRYITTDLLQVKSYINKWGVKIKDKNKTIYRNIECADAVRTNMPGYVKSRNTLKQSDMSLILTFYMQMSKGTVQKMLPNVPFAGPDNRTLVAGHAVSYFGGNNTFFDPNFGVYQVEAGSLDKIADEVEDFITSTYGPSGLLPNASHHNVLRIIQR